MYARRRVGFLFAGLLLVGAQGVSFAFQVSSTSPTRHTFAPPATTIAVTFDQPLLTSSITAASFRVFGKATGRVSGTIAFSNGQGPAGLSVSARPGTGAGTR